MLLQEALDALRDGENVVRELWTPEEGYLALMQGMKHVWKIVLHPNPNAGNYIFSLADLVADDWKVYKFGETQVVEVEQDVCEDNVNAA